MTTHIFYIIYHESDNISFEWLTLSLASLQKFVAVEHLILVTDNLPPDKEQILVSQFGVKVKRIPSTNWEGRRMLCKLEQLVLILNDYAGLDDGQVIMADADILFCGDPYLAFNEFVFDLGYTTRFYPYPSPVNGGMVFYRNTDLIRRFVKQMCSQITNPSWEEYIECKNADNVDWNCDQDMLNTIHRHPVFFQNTFCTLNYKIKTKDVGHKYNYCPGSDVFGTQASAVLLKWAFIERVFPVIHFKGNTKDLLYEPGFGKLLRH